jgi:lipopolysaccharide export system protein LptA
MMRLLHIPVVVGLAVALAASAVGAQQPAQETSGPMQGLSMNRDQPVKIESNTLEVRDKIRQATFSGDVKLTQGDTILKCKVLVVFYEDTAMGSSNASKKGAPAQGAPQAQKGGGGPGGGGQQIKRAEAKGDVFVTQKDQTASGDTAVYDLKSETIVMTGNVVLTQGPQVLRGGKMVVELKTGLYRFESGTRGTDGGGRVEMLANPSAAKDKDAKAAPPAQPAPPAPAAKSTQRPPIRIN